MTAAGSYCIEYHLYVFFLTKASPLSHASISKFNLLKTLHSYLLENIGIMRRSLAPSQRGLCKPQSGGGSGDDSNKKDTNNSPSGRNDDMVISRMPMFGFLEIPENLKKQFKVPTGCIITEK
jgi:hypothetical protein